MKLKLVTVALDLDTGQFPPDPLEGIEGEVLSVVEHFFHFTGIPHLLLVVHYRPHPEVAASERSRSRKHRPDPAAKLSPPERQLYEVLRAWRLSRSEAERVPVFVIFDNKQLATLASQKPSSRAELLAVRGIGDKKAARYGQDVLRVIAEAENPGESADAT